MRAKSQKIIYRLKHACLVNCFDGWRERTSEARELRSKAARVVHRLKNCSLVHCLELWSQLLWQQRQDMARSQKIILRLKRSCLVSVFELWRQNADDAATDADRQNLQQEVSAIRRQLVAATADAASALQEAGVESERLASSLEHATHKVCEYEKRLEENEEEIQRLEEQLVLQLVRGSPLKKR